MMNLCFLMEKRYAPYPKWFGTAFSQLACAKELGPILYAAQRAQDWQERQAALGMAYAYVARMHNALGITEQLPEMVSDFFSRPFMVIHGGQFAEAICRQIADAEVKRIAARRLIGNIDQLSDNTDLHWSSWRNTLRNLYT
jgi:hypothetical protein